MFMLRIEVALYLPCALMRPGVDFQLAVAIHWARPATTAIRWRAGARAKTTSSAASARTALAATEIQPGSPPTCAKRQVTTVLAHPASSEVYFRTSSHGRWLSSVTNNTTLDSFQQPRPSLPNPAPTSAVDSGRSAWKCGECTNASARASPRAILSTAPVCVSIAYLLRCGCLF